MSAATDTKFEFKGLDHVALVVKDMKATVDFYHGVLGLPVLHTLEYFGFQTLTDDANPVTAEPKNPRATPIGSMLLTGLGIPFRHSARYFDPANPKVMRAENSLDKFIQPEEGALMSSVYVSDPSGIQVEFNAWLPGWEKWPDDSVPRSDSDA